MPLSTNLRNRILNAIVGRDSAFGSTVYLGLSSTPLNEDGSGITEPSGNGYTRVLVGSYSQSYTQKFTAAANGAVTNAEDIYFPESTGGWGEPLTHFFLSTSKTGTSASSILAFDVLQADGVAAPVTVTTEKTVVMFRKGQLIIKYTDASIIDEIAELIGGDE